MRSYKPARKGKEEKRKNAMKQWKERLDVLQVADGLVCLQESGQCPASQLSEHVVVEAEAQGGRNPSTECDQIMQNLRE